MIWFKGCSRCGGDLYLDRDSFSFYLSCLQCGALQDLAPEEVEEARLAGRAGVGFPRRRVSASGVA